MPSSTATSTTIADPAGSPAAAHRAARGASRCTAPGFLAIALGFTLSAPLAAQQTTVASLGWLAGCWRQAEAGEVVEEMWLAPAGGTMLGMSRTTEGDSTRTWEHLVIRAGAAGLVYEASPSGQVPAAFLANIVSDTLVTFQNLTHDFPQEIRYRRQSADSLIATVSGMVRERLRSIEFHYVRSACPGS